MKITYFRLKGYIKVLNGMGLDEISIDFSKFKNRIILIQGENGCSKSTIVAALTPNPDSSDSFRTDVIVDTIGNRQIIEYPAEKEIHYIGTDECGNESTYQILIKSIVNDSKTSRTTKAFISKNGEELNPNGNVTSFKEIRDSILGIDPTYLDLSSVSSENRGIVDMLPSDRRKYMAAYIGSLETYGNIYKVISKKVSSLKSYLNTLNAKIYELGNESELRLNLMQLTTSFNEKNKERDKLLKDLAQAEAIVKLIDPDNKMQDLYNSISERILSINSDIDVYTKSVNNLSNILQLNIKSSDIESMIKDTEDNISTHTASLTEKKNQISTLITLNESTTESIDKDKSILIGLGSQSIQDNIEEVANNLKDEIESYKKYITEYDIKVLSNTSIDELNDLREALDNFIREISVAEEMYTIEDFNRAVDASNNNGTIQTKITNFNSKIASNKTKIELNQSKIDSMKKDITTFKEFKNMRPKECIIDNCPYISKYIEMASNIGSEGDLISLQKENESLIEENNRLIIEVDNAIKENEIAIVINGALNILSNKKSIIRKIKQLSYINDQNNIKKLLKSHYKFPDFNIVTDIIQKKLMYNELGRAQDHLKSIEGDLKIYLNNKALKEKLTSSINKAEKEYSDREESIRKLTKDCTFISGLIEDFNTKLDRLKTLNDSNSKLNDLIHDKEDLRKEFESVKDKIKKVKDSMDSLNSIKNNINNIEEAIKPLDDMISNVKYNLSTIINYQSEYKDYSDKYEKMLFIRNACSPGNGMGIQSEYIKRYMNDIIIDCNKMLGYMFNGQIQLDVPMIDEKHFSIPFIGPNGISVPDISQGSTAQKCMIGLVFSCVAMMKSSLRYNIPRFDEIDGGLDQQNRITFINVLNSILDFMNCDQCVIVSHNNEFDTQNTTRLICSHTGIKIEQ